MEQNITNILVGINEDVNREGLLETPKRYVRFLQDFTQSIDINITTFDKEKYNNIIKINKIPFYSLCEHHLLPFFGYASIKYLPNDKIIGLSKMPRIVDKFSRKLQNQERITTDITNFIFETINPKWVMVQLKARHMCIEMRGVKKHKTWTTTKCELGIRN